MNMRIMTLLGTALVFVFAVSLSACQQGQSTESDASEEAESTPVEEASNTESEEAQASPRKQAEGTIDGVSVMIDYGSPAVKGREIWGGLEKWGAVWRAGANETTSVEFDKDVTINGMDLPAGKYGLFIIPNEEGDWVVIFNEEIAWGAFSYKQDKDVLRVEVEPTWADDVQERLEYGVGDDQITFAWEKARIALEVKAGA